MSILSINLIPEELRSLAFGSITSAYGDLGSSFIQPSVIFHIQNNTNAGMLVSFRDGIDHEFIAAGGFLLLDVSTNRSNLAETRNFAQGTQIQVKAESTLPTSGSVYLSTYYAG